MGALVDELSLYRVFRFHQVRHQERIKDLQRSAAASREGEMRVNDAAHALWRRALQCTSTKQSPADRKLYAHHQAVLERARAVLHQDMQHLTHSKSLLSNAQDKAAQSEAQTGFVEKLWRGRARREALRVDEELGEELVGLAVSSRAAQSCERSLYPLEKPLLAPTAARSCVDVASPVAPTFPGGGRSEVQCRLRVSVESAPFAAGFGDPHSIEASGAVALRIEEALPSGDTVSIEVHQCEGMKLDATISVSDGALLSRVAKEKKLLLSRLDAVQVSIDSLEVVAHDAPDKGAFHGMKSRRRAHYEEEDNHEITLT